MSRSLTHRALAPAALAPALALVAIVIGAPALADRPSIHKDPQLEAAINEQFRRCVDFIYDGQLDSAFATVDAVERLDPRDPRVGLVKFRCLRENYPDDIDEEQRAKAKAPSLVMPLDWTIGVCDSIIEADKHSEVAYLYRGWASMMKAQVHAISSDIWPAGGESRRGKNDLDHYLASQPHDVDAGVVLGGYLYFADILPKVVKFIKFFARVPAGDRDRGLELLAAGKDGGGFTAVDSEVVLAVIDYFFEGKIESAEANFVSLAERFPNNPRINELLGSTAIFHPESSLRAREAQTRIIDGFGTRIRGWEDIFLYRLLYARARLSNQMGDYQAAKADLKRIADDSPKDPFWVTPRALLGLAQLASYEGNGQEAAGYAKRILGEEGWSRYHAAAKRYTTLPVGKRQQQMATALAGVRQSLYGPEPDLEAARRKIGEIRAQLGEDARLTYLEAELHRALGDAAAARKGYEQIVAQGNDGGFESTRLMSLIRLGEIDLAAKKYGEATKHYEQAQDIESGYTYIGNMIRGRLRYIEEASKGKT
jgi:hypothetical protein